MRSASQQRVLSIGSMLGLCLVGATTPAGCPSVPALPDQLEVAITATEKQPAARDTGPPGLANTAWTASRRADPDEVTAQSNNGSASIGAYGGLLSGQRLDRPAVGERIFVVRFGEGGRIVEVSENDHFLAEIYGRTVPVGGEWTSALLGGITFRSASYGLQMGDRFGVAAVVNVRFGGAFAGRAILFAWGTIDADRLQGTFGYFIDLRDGLAPFLGSVADQYPFEALRIDE